MRIPGEPDTPLILLGEEFLEKPKTFRQSTAVIWIVGEKKFWNPEKTSCGDGEKDVSLIRAPREPSI